MDVGRLRVEKRNPGQRDAGHGATCHSPGRCHFRVGVGRHHRRRPQHQPQRTDAEHRGHHPPLRQRPHRRIGARVLPTDGRRPGRAPACCRPASRALRHPPRTRRLVNRRGPDRRRARTAFRPHDATPRRRLPQGRRQTGARCQPIAGRRHRRVSGIAEPGSRGHRQRPGGGGPRHRHRPEVRCG